MKTSLVTGSSRGIGRQIGIDLLDKGYSTHFIGKSSESIKILKGELSNYVNTHILEHDLSTIEDNIKLGKYYIKLKINFDIIVCNIGITDRTPFGNIESHKWNDILETNLSGPLFLLQTLKNNINEGGRIIFISSISGIVPDSVSISYGVSKAGINMLVPYLAKEFASKKITVNAVAPGYTMTDWHIDKPVEQLRRIEKKCLANKFGTTKEVSQLVLSICDNDYINGQILRIDGGFGL